MSKAFDEAQRVNTVALEACAPNKMSVSEAVEFYEELISSLEASFECLKEENE